MFGNGHPDKGKGSKKTKKKKKLLVGRKKGA